MPLNLNPWQVRRNGTISASVSSHRTAEIIRSSLARRFPDEDIKVFYQGYPIPLPSSGGTANHG